MGAKRPLRLVLYICNKYCNPIFVNLNITRYIMLFIVCKLNLIINYAKLVL